MRTKDYIRLCKDEEPLRAHLRLIRPSTQDLAEHLAKTIIPQHPDGYTFDVRRWRCRTFVGSAYLTCLWGFEQRFETLPTAQQILPWVERAAPLLQDPGKYAGGWRNEADGKYYLDLAVLCIGRDAAEQFAAICRQRAIYHPASGQELPVNWPLWHARVSRVAA